MIESFSKIFNCVSQNSKITLIDGRDFLFREALRVLKTLPKPGIIKNL